MDTSKVRMIGAAAISAVIMALWSAHVLGFAPNIAADQSEVLKASVYLVTGFWIGSSITPGGTTHTPVAAVAAAVAPAVVAMAVPAAVDALTDLIEGKKE